MTNQKTTSLGEDSQYRQLINQMLDGYALHKIIFNDKGQPVDYRFLDANPAFERITGLKVESIVGHTCLEVFPQIETNWIEKYNKVALTGEPVQFIICSQDLHQHYEVKAFLTAPDQLSCTVNDITERKQVEELLQESEERHRAIFEKNLSIQLLIDPKDGTIIDANSASCDFYGYSPEQMRQMKIMDINTLSKEDVLLEMKAAETNKRNYFNFKHRLADGEIRDVEVYSGTITVKGKELLYSIIHDISERKKAEIREKINYSNIELLSKIAMQFVEFPPDGNIYDFVGEQVRDFVGKDSYIIVNIVDWKTGCSTVNSVLGLGKFTEIITKKLTRNPVGMKFDINDSNIFYKDGKVHVYQEGLYGILLKTVPKSICKSIEKLAGVNKIYIIDLAKQEQFFGSVIIFSKDKAGELKNKQLVEAFLKQASVAILKKQAEEALRITNARHSAMIENIGDIIAVIGVDGIIEYQSPNIEKWFGWTPEDLVGTNGWEHIHPEDIERIQKEFFKLLKKESASLVEYRFKCKDGKYKWIELTGINRISDPVINGVLLNYHDISERKQADLTLAAEKERLAVTLRSIGDGVITTDIKGQIVMLNKAAEELTGWSAADANGRPLPEVFNIINLNTREQCENPVEKVLVNGGVIELENHTSLISKNGKEILIADSGAPIHDKNSVIIGVVLVFRDMTEKHKLEDSIQRTQKLESIGLLAGGIAHDFNNLLSVIFGYIEMAAMLSEEENVTAYLSDSLSQIDRARALTQQLLTFAKGGAPIKKVENLFPFVQETIQFALSGSSVSTVFDIEDNLLPCNFDKNQIGQVLDNLIMNAQQSMLNGGTIDVVARNSSLSEKEHCSLSAGDYVHISIKDQGLGIPKKIIPNIFDPYFTTKPTGHGLGLATCYSIVSKHGGSIDVESESGRGSTFHIYLPASTEATLPLSGELVIEHKGSGTFLVMDDEKELGGLIKAMLESFGYDVVCKENGKDAVDFFMSETEEGRKLAGMIFDLTIPGGMGGKEAIKEIRKVCQATPVFVASGYSVDPIMAEPQKYGFNASLSKPFGLRDLSDMLTKYII